MSSLKRVMRAFVNKSGEIIEWLSQNYDIAYPGTALGFALSSGFVAGENAARYLEDMTG